MTGWQPIETAPKDGTPILAICSEDIGWVKCPYECNFVIVYWDDDEGDELFPLEPAFLSMDGLDAEGLTHWMHLPDLPVQS